MEDMVRIVGVRFKRAGKIYYFTPGELEVSAGDQVLVETAAGLECGEVVIPPKDVPVSDVVQPVRRVLRRLEPSDRDQMVANRDGEREAEAFCKERIAARGLPMKLVNAEYTFDRNRLTFFFVAEERVDFRELVKDLAGRFGCRIEMRQIGVRDQAKEVGGIGVCGRDLCCTTWLGEFAPVSIRMAKDQELSLNPSKLTGQCGRLKCCLKFEADTYRRIRDELPEVGATVRTPKGTGQVVEVLVARESVAVSLGEGRPVLVSLRQMETGEAAVLTGRLVHKNGAVSTGDAGADGDTSALHKGRGAADKDNGVLGNGALEGEGVAPEDDGAVDGGGEPRSTGGPEPVSAGELPEEPLDDPGAEPLGTSVGSPAAEGTPATEPGLAAASGIRADEAQSAPNADTPRSRSRRRRPRRRRRAPRPPQTNEEAG